MVGRANNHQQGAKKSRNEPRSEGVFLGFADEEIPKSEDSNIDWCVNKIGGFSNFNSDIVKDDFIRCKKNLYLRLTKCALCGRAQGLRQVVQLFCPLIDAEGELECEEREIYIYNCPNPECSNSHKGWVAFRVDSAREGDHIANSNTKNHARDVNYESRGRMSLVKHLEKISLGEEKTNEEKEESDIPCDDNWGVDQDEWGVDDGGFDDYDEEEEDLKIEALLEKREEKQNALEAVVEQEKENSLKNKEKEKKEKKRGASFSLESACDSYTASYVYIEEEPGKKKEREAAMTEHERKLLAEYEEKEGVNVKGLAAEAVAKGLEIQKDGVMGSGEEWVDEGYEKTDVKHGDRAFYKYHKRLQRAPEQILRYQLGGKPLLMTDVKEYVPCHGGNVPWPMTNSSIGKRSAPEGERGSTTIPPCASCGGERIFEAQILSTINYYLMFDGQEGEEEDELWDSDSIEHSNVNGKSKLMLDPIWGTVFIYTCQNNCMKTDSKVGRTTFVNEEYVFVQPDLV
eukprot:Nk52_evm66s223 gene=Nk52_evmTU66s223